MWIRKLVAPAMEVCSADFVANALGEASACKILIIDNSSQKQQHCVPTQCQPSCERDAVNVLFTLQTGGFQSHLQLCVVFKCHVAEMENT